MLSVWSGWNCLLGAGIVVAMIGFGRNAPSLSILFSPAEIPSLDPRVPAIVNALAVLFNACAAGLCGVVLALIATGLVTSRPAVFRTVVAAMGLVQGCGFASGAYLGNRYVAANVVSSMALLVGLTLLRSRDRSVTP